MNYNNCVCVLSKFGTLNGKYRNRQNKLATFVIFTILKNFS